MSGSTRMDEQVAALATSGVLSADELMKAIEASHDKREAATKRHLSHAAIGAAVAVGALELLRRDKEKERNGETTFIKGRDGTVVINGNSDRSHHRSHNHHGSGDRDYSPSNHKRRLIEDIVGAYAVGEEMIGHRKHRVAHLVAEAIGAVGAFKDIRDHSNGMQFTLG